MSQKVGAKRLQQILNAAWEEIPGGEVPQVRSEPANDYSGPTHSAKILGVNSLSIDIVAYAGTVRVEVWRRTAPLAWGRERYKLDELEETAKGFQRAAYIQKKAEEGQV